MATPSSRSRVLQLYKNLLHLGKDYPRGEQHFRARLQSAFRKQKDVKDAKQIDMLILRAEFVQKEIEALYMLRKYRALKRMYYSDQLKPSATNTSTTDSKVTKGSDVK